ncbi:MAG: hypothetical protein QW175_05400 [Candidatus Bathyarchaeia archaeon]
MEKKDPEIVIDLTAWVVGMVALAIIAIIAVVAVAWHSHGR